MGVASTFPAELENLDQVRNFIAETGEKLCASEECMDCMVHAVDEAASNIIIHGYKGRPGQIRIVVSREGDNLVVRMRDRAPHFNPTLYRMPNLTLPLKKRPLGGLGIFFMRHFTDELRYCVTGEGDNELTLVKKAFS